MALLGGVIIISVVPGLVMGQVYLERKILARAQDRYGPEAVDTWIISMTRHPADEVGTCFQ